MAEALTPVDEVTAPPGEPAAVDAEARVVEAEPLVVPRAPVASAFQRRFTMAYAVLGVLLALVAAYLAFAVTRALDDGETPWSAWRPAGGGADLDRADQIAAYVSARYRLDGTSQLVAVEADVPSYLDLPAAGYAIRDPRGGGTIEVRDTDHAVQYELCGLGDGCATTQGDPTPERERLLRREALELALYTFRYIGGVDRVATFLPPRAGSPPTWVLLFERRDYRDQLKVPLETTLAGPVPLAEQIGPAEVQRIDWLTEPYRYRFEVQKLQSGTPVFMLEPTASQG